MHLHNDNTKIVCPISGSGYFHVGSLRRILAARKKADELGSKLIVRFDDCYSTFVEPNELFRNVLRGINVSFSLSYFRKALSICEIPCDDIVRMFELLQDVKNFMSSNLREIATSTVSAGDFRNTLIEDGYDSSIVSNMWLLPDDNTKTVAYKLELDNGSVLLEELSGYPGEIVAGLLADQIMDITHRFPDAGTTLISQQLEPIIFQCYPNMRVIENHIVQPININSKPIKEDEYWICKDPEPELAVCRLIQLYGKDDLLAALYRSIDECENDWEVIRERWLKKAYLSPRCCPRHLRFFDAEGPKIETSLHNVPQCSSNLPVVPRVRFAPSASGYLHVGNLRTLIACRDFADSIGGQLFIRIDDDHNECLDQLHVTLSAGLVRAQLAISTQYIIESLKASGIKYDAVYLLSDAAPVVLSLVGSSLATMPNDVRNIGSEFYGYANSKSFNRLLEELGLYLWNPCSGCFRVSGPVGVPWNSISLFRFDGMPSPSVNSIVSDTAIGITYAIRGEELLGLAVSEDYLHAHMPWLHPIENKFVPLLTFNNNVISKSRYHLDFEPETSVLNAIACYGAETLVNALRSSLECNVNNWNEIKSRWLE